MKKCNCRVTYEAREEKYLVSLGMIKRGFDALDMLWDTGAGNSVIYSNLLRNIKNVDKRQLDELENLLTYNKESGTKGKYICGSFGTVSNKGVHGILCCTHNVYVNHLHLEKFYFLYFLQMRIKHEVFWALILFLVVKGNLILHLMNSLYDLMKNYMSKNLRNYVTIIKNYQLMI